MQNAKIMQAAVAPVASSTGTGADAYGHFYLAVGSVLIGAFLVSSAAAVLLTLIA